MHIGIVTLPIHDNYGMILQNYALQKVLRSLGHTPITLNFLYPTPLWRVVLSTCKTLLLYFIPGRRCSFSSYRVKQSPQIKVFVDKYIIRTRPIRRYTRRSLCKYRIEGLIVGSDQVWRPRFNRYLEDMFLRFAQHEKIRKVAYAASFGVGTLEFSERQLQRCAPLLQQFDKVSVREASGVDLCRNYFHVEAEHVLDPTLLLDHSDYERLCAEVPRRTEKFMACYILDPTEEQRRLIDCMAQQMHMTTKYFTSYHSSLTVEEWLAMFRDAAYVVTDSFHGTVFSIIFGKPFTTILNKDRGEDRFTSLLRMLSLEKCLISSVKELPEELYNWHMNDAVDAVLSLARKAAKIYLQDALK